MSDTTKLHRYAGAGVTVTYDARRCIHAAECVHGLPQVFDPKVKPWIQPGTTDADRLAAVIHRCPSGALKLERDDGATEPVPQTNTATLTRDGPTYLHGDFAFVDADGGVTSADTRIALCRCGASQNKPFCDGSHRERDFRHEGALAAAESAPLPSPGGRVTIRARPNGPLMLTGSLTVVGTNGRAAHSETTFLCRCGQSANKPYCDGTHKRIGFTA